MCAGGFWEGILEGSREFWSLPEGSGVFRRVMEDSGEPQRVGKVLESSGMSAAGFWRVLDGSAVSAGGCQG